LINKIVLLTYKKTHVVFEIFIKYLYVSKQPFAIKNQISACENFVLRCSWAWS